MFIVIIIVTIGLVIDEIIVPGDDPANTRLINWITSMIDTIIGALIGFVAGAAVVSKANGNGKPVMSDASSTKWRCGRHGSGT